MWGPRARSHREPTGRVRPCGLTGSRSAWARPQRRGVGEMVDVQSHFSPSRHLRQAVRRRYRAHSAPTHEQMLEGTLDLERSASVRLPAPLRGLRRPGPVPSRVQEGPWQEGQIWEGGGRQCGPTPEPGQKR